MDLPWWDVGSGSLGMKGTDIEGTSAMYIDICLFATFRTALKFLNE